MYIIIIKEKEPDIECTLKFLNWIMYIIIIKEKEPDIECICHFESIELIRYGLFQMWVYQHCLCQSEQATSSTHVLTSTSIQQVGWVHNYL